VSNRFHRNEEKRKKGKKRGPFLSHSQKKGGTTTSWRPKGGKGKKGKRGGDNVPPCIPGKGGGDLLFWGKEKKKEARLCKRGGGEKEKDFARCGPAEAGKKPTVLQIAPWAKKKGGYLSQGGMEGGKKGGSSANEKRGKAQKTASPNREEIKWDTSLSLPWRKERKREDDYRW